MTNSTPLHPDFVFSYDDINTRLNPSARLSVPKILRNLLTAVMSRYTILHATRPTANDLIDRFLAEVTVLDSDKETVRQDLLDQ